MTDTDIAEIPKSKLNERQRKFVDIYVEYGRELTRGQCALRAGYNATTADSAETLGRTLLKNPKVQAEIYHLAVQRFSTAGISVAQDVLIEIAKSKDQPASARVRAASELIKASGLPYRYQAQAQQAVDQARQESALVDMDKDQLASLASSLDEKAKMLREILATGAIDAEYTEVSDPPPDWDS